MSVIAVTPPASAASAVARSVDAILQVSVDDAYRGRVFSFYDVVFNACFVAAAVAGAVLLPPDGYSPGVLAATAMVYLGAAAAYYTAVRRSARGAPMPVPDDGIALRH